MASHNSHSNASALILAAAEQSGLLDKVANALCFFDKVPSDGDPACELVFALAQAFEIDGMADNVDNVVDVFHGEDASAEMPHYTKKELRPYTAA